MRRARLAASAALTAGAIAVGWSAFAQTPPPTWTNAVGAVFAANCTSCHGGDIGSAGLRLTTYANAIAGSRNGPVLISGNPDESLLMRRIRGQIPPRMPRDAPALPIDTIRLIAAWIQAGMPE